MGGLSLGPSPPGTPKMRIVKKENWLHIPEQRWGSENHYLRLLIHLSLSLLIECFEEYYLKKLAQSEQN